jgi:hypothetical protein
MLLFITVIFWMGIFFFSMMINFVLCRLLILVAVCYLLCWRNSGVGVRTMVSFVSTVGN